MRRLAGMAVLLAVSIPTTLVAQGLSGGGMAYRVQHRVLYQGSVLEQTGTFVGGQGSVRLGPARLGVSGLMGTLGGGDDPANPEKKVRASSVTVLIEAYPGLAVGAEAEGIRFEADAGTTAWRLIGVHGQAAIGLDVPGLAGTAELSYFPSASVIDGEKITLAFRGTVGVSYDAPRGPLTLSLGYRFERFDFEASGTTPARLEQFRGVVVGAGIELGR